MPVIDKYKQIQENIQLKKNTPLQDKVDEIQKKVDEQNRQKALQNVANVQNKTELANADNLVKRTGMTTMYNTSSNPPQTPWQQVAAQNLQNKGIDPTKLGTGTGESYQPYTPTTQPTEPVTPTTTTVTPLQQKVDAIQKQVDANNEAIKQWQVSPIQQKLEQDKLNRINSKVSLYSNGESLYNAVQGGSILPWTQEWTTLAQTKPEIIQQYDVIKKQKDNYNQVKVLGEAIVWDVQPPQPSNALQNLLAYFQKDLSTDIAWEYQNTVINNPAYQGSVQKFNDINQQIADNNKNIQALRDDVRKKYSAWTPESLIASAIAREARPLIEQGQYLSQLQANAESEMTRILEENKSVFEMKQKQQERNQNTAMQLYWTIRAEEIRIEDLARKDEELRIQMEQARTTQEYNEFKDQRDYNLKVAQALSDEEYKNKQLDIQNRPKASDYLKFEVPNEDGSVSTVYRNPLTWQEMSSSQVFGRTPATSGGWDAPISQYLSSFSPAWQALLTVPDGTVIPTRLGEVSPQNASVRGKECAEYVNDIVGTKMGSTYDSKLAVCNEATGWVGSVVAWKPTGSGNFGHTGIIVDEDANNYYVKSSNYVPWTVTTEKIPKESIKNFYTPPEIKQAQETEQAWPQPIKYPNGNVRTPDGTLYTKKEVTELDNKIKWDEQYKRASTTLQYFRALDRLNELVWKYGTEIWPLASIESAFGGTAKSELQSAYNDVLFAEKEYRNLGVLNWPDVGLLTSGLPSPVSFTYTNAAWEDIKISGTPFNDKVLRGIKNKKLTLEKELEDTYNTLNLSNQNLGNTLPSLKALDDIRKRASIWTEEWDIEQFINQ